MSISKFEFVLQKMFSESLRVTAPPRLAAVLRLLQLREETFVEGLDPCLHPLLVPLSKHQASGNITGFLLNVPSSKRQLQLVSSDSTGRLTLLAPSSTAFIHRCAAEADSNTGNIDAAEIKIANEETLVYSFGSVPRADQMALVRYLALKVGPFPDVMESLALHHLEKRGDRMAALVASERSVCSFRDSFQLSRFWQADANRGWARGYWFQSQMLTRLERDEEARDSARAALLQPL